MQNMLRSKLNKILSDASHELFGPSSIRSAFSYERSEEGTLFPISFTEVSDKFEAEAKRILDIVVENIESLIDESVGGTLKTEQRFLGFVNDIGWIVGVGGALVIEARITLSTHRYAMAEPALSLMRNIDTDNLVMQKARLTSPYEQPNSEIASIDNFDLAPGEDFFCDSRVECQWPITPGVLILKARTLQLGAYDALFDVETKRRVGLFSCDPRISGLDACMRVFASLKDQRAKPLATNLTNSPVKELRWNALNYFWRMGQNSVLENVPPLVDDEDPSISSLAKAALSHYGVDAR